MMLETLNGLFRYPGLPFRRHEMAVKNHCSAHAGANQHERTTRADWLPMKASLHEIGNI